MNRWVVYKLKNTEGKQMQVKAGTTLKLTVVNSEDIFALIMLIINSKIMKKELKPINNFKTGESHCYIAHHVGGY